MKNKPFCVRLGFAFSGIKTAFQKEASFRIQSVCAIAALGSLVFFHPLPLWWALVSLTCASVLAAELVNTALESMMDCLHPEAHPLMGTAKDCAAGAVLVLSAASLVVYLAMLCSL